MKRGVVIAAVAVLLVLVVVTAVGVVLSRHQVHDTFHQTFAKRCKRSRGTDCERMWSTFEQAYVGKGICKVPTDAYNPLFELVNFNKDVRNAMFWSKTKDVVHDFVRNGCFVTMEDTLLGSVLDGLSWCGKEGSKKTFTSNQDCHIPRDCNDNPVHSFWRKGSACFAQAVSGHATVMLNGSVSTPYNMSSVFASIEVPNLNPAKVKKLTVVLVTPETPVSTCLHKSFGDLKDNLTKHGISYDCKEVSETRIKECGSNTDISCPPCW